MTIDYIAKVETEHKARIEKLEKEVKMLKELVLRLRSAVGV